MKIFHMKNPILGLIMNRWFLIRITSRVYFIGAETGGLLSKKRERLKGPRLLQILRYLLSNIILTNGSYGYNYHD